MSTFKVSIEQINKIWPHPNADKLELASVEGMTFQFCVNKGVYSVGDYVVYFPVDSVLPDSLVEKFNIRNFLTGSKKDRLKTVKLRGEISQGFVAKFETVFPGQTFNYGEDVTERLGVIKYEPPEVVCKAGRLVQLPSGVSIYDIEGCDRNPIVVEQLMDQPVYISEKIEGSNASIKYQNAEFNYCQRRYEVKPDPTIEQIHDWIRVPNEIGLCDKIKQISNDFNGASVIVRGEMTGPGIQGNIYKLSKVTLFVFDIQINEKYLDAGDFLQITSKYDIQTVPLISFNITLREWLNGKTVQQASNGTSQLYQTLREGIVIKPIHEQFSTILNGRLFIKQRDPIYLDKTGN